MDVRPTRDQQDQPRGTNKGVILGGSFYVFTFGGEFGAGFGLHSFLLHGRVVTVWVLHVPVATFSGELAEFTTHKRSALYITQNNLGLPKCFDLGGPGATQSRG